MVRVVSLKLSAFFEFSLTGGNGEWREQTMGRNLAGKECTGGDAELLVFCVVQFMPLGLCKSGDIPRHAISNGIVPLLI